MLIRRIVLLFAVVSASQAKSLPDDVSVVSVYTTLPTTSGTNELDVYQQIANNLAERITTPFYRFFGLQRNKTETDIGTTKKPWQKIELLDDGNDNKTTRKENKGRDVEELSVEALNKKKEKPEKVTLYNSYLPLSARIEANDTVNEVNIDGEDDIDNFNNLTLDDVTETVREGPFVFFLEWIASAFQIAWGAISAIFKPST